MASKHIFYTQVAVTATVMGFCIAMLAKGESASIYLPVLSGISGWWLPSPSLKKDEPTAAPATAPPEPAATEPAAPPSSPSSLQDRVVAFVGKKVADIV